MRTEQSIRASGGQRDTAKQIRLYAEWCAATGTTHIHIYPPKKTGYAKWALEELLKQNLNPSTRLIEVNPNDWKPTKRKM